MDLLTDKEFIEIMVNSGDIVGSFRNPRRIDKQKKQPINEDDYNAGIKKLNRLRNRSKE
jgi:hypothetical protein